MDQVRAGEHGRRDACGHAAGRKQVKPGDHQERGPHRDRRNLC